MLEPTLVFVIYWTSKSNDICCLKMCGTILYINLKLKKSDTIHRFILINIYYLILATTPTINPHKQKHAKIPPQMPTPAA